jgi:hypothetical protein
MNERIDDLEFTNRWTNKLLQQLDGLRGKNPSGEDIEKAIGECSLPCFQKNKFDETLKGFSNLQDFLRFCETDLGWKVDYDEQARTIVCYEGNEQCLCPIVRLNKDISPAICCCTQGEIRRMFEYALKLPVEVEIIHPIVRDGQRCVYKVQLTEA